MDIKDRAARIVADYDKLYGDAIRAQMNDVTQPLSWELLSKTNAFVYPKLRDGIEAALSEAAGVGTTPKIEIGVTAILTEKADVPPPAPVTAPVLHGKGKFAPRPVPSREELWGKVSTPGMSMSKMALGYKTKKESVRKWLLKRGIAWTTGSDPVLIDGYVEEGRA